MTILTIPQLELLIFLEIPVIPKWVLESPGFGTGSGYGIGSQFGYGYTSYHCTIKYCTRK